MTNTVAVLGTGLMGAGMARNLVRAGFGVTVWNRTADKARPLADDGATVADDPAAAVTGADVVLTILFDADAVEQVMTRALPACRPDAVWVQASTVGLAESVRLAALAARHGVAFVDAPVLGTKQPAEAGTLTVLAGGPVALRPRVEPVFEAVGSRTIWVGERVDDGHRLKLVANAWIQAITVGTAQSIALAGGLGLDPQLFLDAIAGAPTDCGYAHAKGRAMMAGDFAAAFTVAGVVKDNDLIRDASREAGVDETVLTALGERFRATAAAGHSEDDMAAVIRAMTDHAASPTAPGQAPA